MNSRKDVSLYQYADCHFRLPSPSAFWKKTKKQTNKLKYTFVKLRNDVDINT